MYKISDINLRENLYIIKYKIWHKISEVWEYDFDIFTLIRVYEGVKRSVKNKRVSSLNETEGVDWLLLFSFASFRRSQRKGVSCSTLLLSRRNLSGRITGLVSKYTIVVVLENHCYAMHNNLEKRINHARLKRNGNNFPKQIISKIWKHCFMAQTIFHSTTSRDD